MTKAAMSMLAQWDDVLRNLPSAVVVFDAAGQVAQINPACLEFFRLRLHPAELIGQGWRTFFDHIAPLLQDPEPELARIKALIHQDTPDQAEIALNDGRHLLRHYVPLVRHGEPRGALWQLQDITSIKKQQSELEYLTERDPLTGLLNRRGLDRRLQILRHHPLGQQGYTLALIDLDDFKHVNDTLGHPAGDAVLAEVARRIQSIVRLTDMPARISGDEFAILMPECRTEETAVQIGDRLVRTMRTPMQVAATALQPRCSVGLAVQKGRETQDCFQRADLALYEAKRAGRDRFQLFSPRLKRQHDALQQQRSMLRDGLEQGRLQVYFQPVLTLSPETGTFFVRKFEALLRLQDAQGQLHQAAEFETALADPQLGIEVDRHVLNVVLRQLVAWQRQGWTLRVAINISPHHFVHPGFVDTVRESLTAHAEIHPQQIALEITEHGPALNLRVVNAAILELRRMGLSIGLDDFGTGNASLAHLQQFDISIIKIDRRFVRDLLQDGVDSSLSYGMLRLAQMLGIGAIAEGVETRAQCRALCLLGFRHLQGYVFAHPMPAEQVPPWLDRHQEALSWLNGMAKPEALDTERAVQALVTHRLHARKVLSHALDAADRQTLMQPQAPHQCDLGRWLAQQTEQEKQSPAYQRLVHAHTSFHAWMRKVIDQTEADADLQLSNSSAEVHAAFWDWVLRDANVQSPRPSPQD